MRQRSCRYRRIEAALTARRVSRVGAGEAVTGAEDAVPAEADAELIATGEDGDDVPVGACQ
jgi:hypothetical protein